MDGMLALMTWALISRQPQKMVRAMVPRFETQVSMNAKTKWEKKNSAYSSDLPD